MDAVVIGHVAQALDADAQAAALLPHMRYHTEAEWTCRGLRFRQCSFRCAYDAGVSFAQHAALLHRLLDVYQQERPLDHVSVSMNVVMAVAGRLHDNQCLYSVAITFAPGADADVRAKNLFERGLSGVYPQCLIAHNDVEPPMLERVQMMPPPAQ